MSNIVDFSDDEEVIQKPIEIKHTPKPETSIVVDTRYQNKSNLLVHIEGSSWIVNYYSQVLGQDNAPVGQAPTTNPVYQQYKEVTQFELKVTSPLTQSQDTDTKELTVVGTATIYPYLIPNEGDMFTADVGDGREAIFKITNSERRSIYKDTTYVIDYVLINYATKPLLTDLKNKVIDSFVFKRDFLKYGQNPILLKSDYQIIEELQVHFKEMIHVYISDFFSNEFRTLIIPGQAYSVYDHHLVKAIKMFFNTNDHPDIQKIKLLNVSGDENLKANTVWDMLYRLDKRLMNHIHYENGLVSTKLFTKDPMMDGIYHSGIQYIVYPKTVFKPVDYDRKDLTKPFSPNKLAHINPRTNLPEFNPPHESTCTACNASVELDIDLRAKYIVRRDNLVDSDYDYTDDIIDDTINGHQWDYSDVIDLTDIDPDSFIVPDIHKVTIDDYYILTSCFYKQNNGLQKPGMSKLEIMLCRMLDKKNIDNAMLLALCENYHSWGALERFYLTPFVMILIQYAVRSN